MPDSMLLDPAAALIGRDTELARIARTLARTRHETLLITGTRGTGKSLLLAAAAQLARDSGRYRVVLLRALSDEDALLRQLALAFRNDVSRLPGSEAGPVRAFLGLADGGEAAPDREVLRATLRSVITAANRERPLLITADDVDGLDDEAAAALAYVTGPARVLLLAGRHGRIPPALAALTRIGLTRIGLAPLDTEQASRLLEAQDDAPTGRTRAGILRRSAGNPAAIIELSSARPDGGKLQAAYASALAALPERTRWLLLHLAAADGGDADVVSAAARVADPAAWPEAEQAELVVRSAGRVEFTHPLAAAAAYRSSTAHQRRDAHRNLAAVLTGDTESRALHLAAAGSGRDEAVAQLLEEAAGIFREREDLFEATAAMQQAAERSVSLAAAARRFAQAATDARNLGAPDWTTELYAAVRRLTADPDLITLAAHAAATSLSRSGRQFEAYGLVAAARRAGVPTDRLTRLTMTGLAAAIAAISGHEEHRQGLAAMLAEVEPEIDPANAIFVRLIIEPSSRPGRALCESFTPPPSGAPLTPHERLHLTIVGTIAGYEDFSRLAVGVLRTAMDDAFAPRTSLSGIETIPVLVSALIDTGQWDLADRYASGLDIAGLPVFGANLNALRAQLLALRGDGGAALRLVRQVWSRLDIEQHRSIHARLLRAAGLAAMAAGDYDDAYRYLRSMFDHDGRPLQTFVAGRCVAELAAAAARCGRRDDVRPILDGVRADAGEEPSARMRLLLHLAEALLSEGEQAERHFRLATVDAAGQEWPYERAVARLHYGEWLRRARRPRDARAMLSAAENAFTLLGAAHAAVLAARELQASGQHQGQMGGSGASLLTPQESEVARLAARGLRNREIAEQLFISSRTVGAHLRSVYAKLGVSGRHQLGGAFPRD